MTWLNSLKIAIVNNNRQKALDLIENLPNFDNIDDLICAREIVYKLLNDLVQEKKTTSEHIYKLKQMKSFLED
ncbi:hypothetical protein [Helicobacter sp. MIT 14-3879]|uniref:hypothetical protein n=1 Tax=Helicobacter sp. MIT 14-3879 TaxID=2040649 RepID=UPI000E1EFDC0|nr:hypothetical protein [Helicobacter sp. MIT 14-3879]RDU64729.1 hypothetical protein CQA44_03180 [Helicobacter sp. MIT 14-3879]